MTVLERLRPCDSPLVMDLVSAAGVDVSAWAISKKGFVKVPASNPAYCYEWAFVEHRQRVVVNLWHEQIVDNDGKLTCDLNLRRWSETQQESSALRPSQRSSRSRRAQTMDRALIHAYEHSLELRIILGVGERRDLLDPKAARASQMKKRLLDPEPWFVELYDQQTGQCLLVRGIRQRFVDQFSLRTELGPKRSERAGSAWERDRSVRDLVLVRANGRCEFCGTPGFKTSAGSIYLETHHVVPLSEGGIDREHNIVAVCPNDHRRAHHSKDRAKIQDEMTRFLKKTRSQEI